MMLNADMALIKEMTGVTGDGQVTGCTYDTCANSEDDVAAWVRVISLDNTQFLQEFGAVFEKMIQHGYTVNTDDYLV